LEFDSMKLSLALTLIACMLTGNAHAYTQCTGLALTGVFTDNGGNLFVSTGGYQNGYVPPTMPGYKTAVAIALAAMTSGALVTIRYARDGVVCGAAAWNEEIAGIGM
jgi:hypothetical protein